MWRTTDNRDRDTRTETNTGEHVEKRFRRTVVALLALVIVFSAFLTPLSAAAASGDGTTVYLVEQSGSTTVGSQTTFDVVVDSANDGVGAYDISVDVADPSVGSIAHVKQYANPKIGGPKIAADGSSATIRAALMEQSEGDSVRVASITIDGDRRGRTDLSLSVSALGDHGGTSYTVSDVSGATLVVESAHDDDDDDDDIEKTSTPTSDDVTAPSSITVTDDEPRRDDAATTATATTNATTTATATTNATTADRTVTTADSEPSPETKRRMPGFTLPLTILALLTAGLIAARRR